MYYDDSATFIHNMPTATQGQHRISTVEMRCVRGAASTPGLIRAVRVRHDITGIIGRPRLGPGRGATGNIAGRCDREATTPRAKAGPPHWQCYFCAGLWLRLGRKGTSKLLRANGSAWDALRVKHTFKFLNAFDHALQLRRISDLNDEIL